jgi:hypothetical protein
MDNKIYYFYSKQSESSMFYKLFLENLSRNNSTILYSCICIDNPKVEKFLKIVWKINQVPAIIYNNDIIQNKLLIDFLQKLSLRKSILSHKEFGTNKPFRKCTTPISEINLRPTTGNLEIDEQIQKAVKTTSIMDKVKNLQLEREREALIK